MARDLEQARRDLMINDPDLYVYIINLNTSKIWDSAGDNVSGDHNIANIFWRWSADARKRAEAARISHLKDGDGS